MRRQSVLLGVLVWALVVTAASGVTWAVIDGAGQSLLADDTVTETQPVPTAAAASSTSRGPGSADASPRRSPTARSSRPVPTAAASSSPLPSASPAAPRGSVGPGGVTRTWEGPPGLVTVRCVGGRPRFESATPSNGYRFEVEQEGVGELEVKFESATREFKVAATCAGGVPRYAVEADEE